MANLCKFSLWKSFWMLWQYIEGPRSWLFLLRMTTVMLAIAVILFWDYSVNSETGLWWRKWVLIFIFRNVNQVACLCNIIKQSREVGPVEDHTFMSSFITDTYANFYWLFYVKRTVLATHAPSSCGWTEHPSWYPKNNGLSNCVMLLTSVSVHLLWYV